MCIGVQASKYINEIKNKIMSLNRPYLMFTVGILGRLPCFGGKVLLWPAGCSQTYCIA